MNDGQMIAALAAIVGLLVTALGIVVWWLATRTISRVDSTRDALLDAISDLRAHVDRENGKLWDRISGTMNRVTRVETIVGMRNKQRESGI